MLPLARGGRTLATLCFNVFNESGWFGGTPDLARLIRAAAAAGFDSVGLDLFSLQRHAQAGGRVEDLVRWLDDAGLRCAEIAALMIGPDPDEVDAQLAGLLPIVRALRPDWVLTNADIDPDERAASLVRRCAEPIGALGARLALEFLPFMRVGSIGAARELVSRADAGAGVLVDTWHFFHGPDGWAELDALPLEQLAYVQFDDHPALESTDLREECLHRRVFPGEGLFELERFCASLRGRGWDGLVSVEVLSSAWRGGDLEAFARRAYETSAPYWPSP
jgi:sugar phosphate isomerase/epimerase